MHYLRIKSTRQDYLPRAHGLSLINHLYHPELGHVLRRNTAFRGIYSHGDLLQ